MRSPLTNPALNSDLPLYPQVSQVVRITGTQVPGPAGVSQLAGSSVLAPQLYVGFVQQSRNDSLLPRDREPCLAASVNGVALAPGYYSARLVNSFNGLPVYYIGLPSPSVSVELRGLTFTADTSSTVDSDPGPGKMRWNDATQASATKLFFDDVSVDGANAATTWDALGTAGFLVLQQADDSSKWQIWKWIQSPVDGTGYHKFGGASASLVLMAHSGAIDNGKLVYVLPLTIPDASSTSGGGISMVDQDMGKGVKNFIDGTCALSYASPAAPADAIARFNDFTGLGVSRPDGAGLFAYNPTGAPSQIVSFGVFPHEPTAMPGDANYNPIVVPGNIDTSFRQTVYACWDSSGSVLNIGQNSTGLNSDCVFTGGILTDAGSVPFSGSTDDGTF